MAERDQKWRQNLEEFLDSLDDLIIVEGDSDLRALTRLGVDPGIIVVLNKGQSLEQTVAAISEAGCAVILTDMDAKGKMLRSKLLGLFALYGIAESKRPRKLFARLKMSHVEGLKRF